jgi:arginine decarboxylase
MEKRDFVLPNPEKEISLVRDLWEIYQNVNRTNINEYYNDLIEKKRDILQLFTYGVLSLEQRAKAEDLYWAVATKMVQLAKGIEDAETIVKDLEKDLSDTYFCNFSVFQSLPDSWALEQVFPVMPIQRLEERPDRKAILVDLTCDSDGHITNFIDTENGQIQNHLAVHTFRKGEPYYIGVFLAGAYQEILGDLHNLFGDTDAVYVSTTPNGYSIDHVVEGDAVTDVLSFVEYGKPELLERVRRATETSIARGSLSPSEARLLLKHFEQGLNGYTYLFEA